MQFVSGLESLSRRRPRLVARTVACIAIGSSISHAQALRPVTVAIQQCAGASCAVAEGLQAGLSVVDVSGSARQLGGSTIRLSITPSPGPALDSRSVGVMSNGKFTVSIPAYRFPAGRYTWILSSRSTQRPVAQGQFSVTAKGRTPVKAVQNGSESPTGVWTGINGTAGTIDLLPGGSYKYAGEVGGHYTASGETITFTGTLGSWNGGRARYDGKTIEFEWTRSDGRKNYFVFAK